MNEDEDMIRRMGRQRRRPVPNSVDTQKQHKHVPLLKKMRENSLYKPVALICLGGFVAAALVNLYYANNPSNELTAAEFKKMRLEKSLFYGVLGGIAGLVLFFFTRNTGKKEEGGEEDYGGDAEEEGDGYEYE